MNIVLIIDTRTRPLLKPLTQTVLRTTARQCLNLFNATRLAASHGLATVAVHCAGVRHIARVCCTDHTADDVAPMQELQRALGSLGDMTPEVVGSPCGPGRAGEDPSAGDKLALVRALLTAEPSAPTGVPRTVVYVSAYVTYAEVFSGLAPLTTTALSDELRCIVVDAEAVQVTRASLGPRGTLLCSSADPVDLRAALQSVLVPGLLPALLWHPRRPRPPAESAVRVCVRLGSAVAIPCVAVRPYLCPLHRCATADVFDEAGPGHLSRVLLADGRVAESGFEVTRAVERGAEVVLQLEAVVPLAETAAEGFDNTWLATPASEAADSQAAAALGAAYEAFAGCALVLRCVGGDVGLAASHRLAVQSSSYMASFLSPALLLLRQVIPTELVRVLLPPAAAALASPPRDVVDALRLVKEQVTAQQCHPDFSLDSLLESGLGLLAGQLRVTEEYTLQLTRRRR